jgi:hypothetical protein
MMIALLTAAGAPIVMRMFIVTEGDAAVIRDLFETERAVSRHRVAPAVPRDHRHREGARI